MLESFQRPTQLNEALALLSSEGSRVLNGGTDIMIQLGLGYRVPKTLVDLKLIDDLHILEWEDDCLRIGACAIVERLCHLSGFRDSFRALYDGCADIGSAQIRERATISGNVAHASPCADSVPGLYCSGAKLILASSRAERELPIEKFFLGPGKTVLEPGEIIKEIRIPRPSSDYKSAFAKIKRVKGHDLALVNLALSVGNGVLRCAIGSCAPTCVFIEISDFNEKLSLSSLLELVDSRIAPIDDVRASAAYRRAMVQVLTKRLWEEIVDEPRA